MRLIGSINDWWEDKSFPFGRLVALVVVFSVVFGVPAFLGTYFGLPQILAVKQQWEWAEITPNSDQNSSNSSVFIELEGFRKKEARFRLKSNNPDLFPCWLQFPIEPKRTVGFSVEEFWFKAIEHRLQLPKETQDAQLCDDLILRVDSLSDAKPLRFALSLENVHDIDTPSLREAFFGQKKSFAGSITLSIGVPQNIDASRLHARSNTWLPIGVFDYVVAFKPGIRFH